MADIVFCGPLPPPVTGQAVAAAALLENLTTTGLEVRAFDTGPGASASQLRRVTQHVRAALALAFDHAPHFYSTVNDHRGMLATTLLAAIARLRSKSITLHHHSARSLVAHDPSLGLLARVAGCNALHVTQGEQLAAQFRQKYGIANTASYSNIGIVATPSEVPPPNAEGPVMLGHLSNLCEEKGIGRAIDTLRAQLKKGIDAQLITAGPCVDDFSRTAVALAQQEFGERFEYLGPIYGVEKEAFFRRIDVFLFPSAYIPEAQPIVTLEALAFGRPVISYARGCIADAIGADGGLTIPPNVPFVPAAVSWLSDWRKDRLGAFDRARAQFASLQNEHRIEHMALTDRLAL